MSFCTFDLWTFFPATRSSPMTYYALPQNDLIFGLIIDVLFQMGQSAILFEVVALIHHCTRTILFSLVFTHIIFECTDNKLNITRDKTLPKHRPLKSMLKQIKKLASVELSLNLREGIDSLSLTFRDCRTVMLFMEIYQRFDQRWIEDSDEKLNCNSDWSSNAGERVCLYYNLRSTKNEHRWFVQLIWLLLKLHNNYTLHMMPYE